MLKGYFTNINKENELKSIKEETDYFKSKINRNKNSFSSISSSLSSSDSKVNQIKKIGKDTNNNAEKTNIIFQENNKDYYQNKNKNNNE